ncbi:fatty acyl-CoA reductase wat-like, partial [Hyposmocoma kahamanoa]|uniref:fatty acyl-CoA reductase wat-like n=1 Tax=Hyposmocoma kahamanoa TaxID=1477025 RepID=UPI000E6D7D1B
MIRLGKACKNIRSIVHVSTAFSHATLSRRGTDIAEAFYDTPIAPKLLIEMSENIESNILHDMTPSILKDWPNTYTFTKAVAEEIVRTMGAHLPICVVRPGI